MAIENLWGDIPIKANIDRTPLTLLQEQASILGQATNNLLVGEVNTWSSQADDRFYAELYIVAPTLNEYRYSLFEVSYPLGFYPVTITLHAGDGTKVKVKDEEEFKQALSTILQSTKVHNVVQRLVNHIKIGEGESF